MANCPIDGRIQVGNEIRSTGTFTNAVDNNNPLDPSNVFLKVTTPSGSETIYEYNVDIEVMRLSIGVYYVDLVLTEAGEWLFKWYSTADPVVTEISLRVLSTVS